MNTDDAPDPTINCRPCAIATGWGFMAKLFELEGMDTSLLLGQQPEDQRQACQILQQAAEQLRDRADAKAAAQDIVQFACAAVEDARGRE